jgi:hypothetical protein
VIEGGEPDEAGDLPGRDADVRGAVEVLERGSALRDLVLRLDGDVGVEGDGLQLNLLLMRAAVFRPEGLDRCRSVTPTPTLGDRS